MPYLTKNIAVMLLAPLLILTSITTVAADNSFSKKQQDDINNMIRAYILEHPEILPEAIQILQNRSKKALLSQNHTRLYEDGFSFVGGNRDGDVTVVEFFDYNCGYCKKAFSTVERLKKTDGNIRIIYKEFPILSEVSYVASKAAMASIKQGKYEVFHKALLNNNGKLTEDKIFSIARGLGMDEKKLAKDMTNPLLERNIQVNHSLAKALDITGTPGFVIGNAIIPGAVPYEQLMALIGQARRQAKTTAK